MRHFFTVASLCSILFLVTAVESSGQSTAVPMRSHPLEPTSFGFQCVNGSSCGSNGSWITSITQPGTVRLWDAGTPWAILQKSSNTYNWSNLDTWLDMIAAHQPMAVIYTFGHVPCFIASVACNVKSTSSKYWSTAVPKDLNTSGSATFNNFVTALTKHCSAKGNCVRTYIKYFELWNEPNLSYFWTGTQAQLYNMVKPAVAIIRSNVAGAVISTPAICGGDKPYMTSWLNLENSKGRLSDYYSIHSYLSTYEPEARMDIIAKMVQVKNDAGWTRTPWMNTETNFDVGTYLCDAQFTVADCRGQFVRWHVLQYAYQGGAGGAIHVGWYNWPSITSGGYDTYYYTMMKWLEGSTFTTSCSNSGNVYTCPLTEANGAIALIVWNTTGNTTYTPASQYVNYREFDGTYGGATVSISPGQKTTIGLIPVMFETK
jgi:hypothetical protein